MGWGCYRHEIDAESESWNAQIDALLPDGASHGKPFNWGRDGQVCPFCWAELEKIKTLYEQALSDIMSDPGIARRIATETLKKATEIVLCRMDPEAPQKQKAQNR